MATTTELVDLVNAVVTEVGKIGPAVNALEAAVTAALAQIGQIPAAEQEKIDAAFASLQGVLTGVQTAVVDATDGIDEGK